MPSSCNVLALLLCVGSVLEAEALTLNLGDPNTKGNGADPAQAGVVELKEAASPDAVNAKEHAKAAFDNSKIDAKVAAKASAKAAAAAKSTRIAKQAASLGRHLARGKARVAKAQKKAKFDASFYPGLTFKTIGARISPAQAVINAKLQRDIANGIFNIRVSKAQAVKVLNLLIEKMKIKQNRKEVVMAMKMPNPNQARVEAMISFMHPGLIKLGFRDDQTRDVLKQSLEYGETDSAFFGIMKRLLKAITENDPALRGVGKIFDPPKTPEEVMFEAGPPRFANGTLKKRAWGKGVHCLCSNKAIASATGCEPACPFIYNPAVPCGCPYWRCPHGPFAPDCAFAKVWDVYAQQEEDDPLNTDHHIDPFRDHEFYGP